MTVEQCRRFYADEIRFAANLTSPALVEAFAKVPREEFLGPGPWQIGSADVGTSAVVYTEVTDPRDVYHNVVVALDAERKLNNGQPGALAVWIKALDLKAGDRVFHVGCGVGYFTAVMAEVVGSNGQVVACEVDEGLAARAKENLAPYPNVTVYAADGAVVDPGDCDAMLINAGVTHPHPAWLDRLRDGGRMVLPITMAIPGNPGLGKGLMAKIVRCGDALSAGLISFVAIYSCTTVRDPELEPLLTKALATQALFKLKSVRRDPHEPTDTCLLHRTDVCISSVPPAP